jgi:iron complex outermembrane receptor protein
VHWHADGIEAKASVFMNRYDDFIYLAATGEEEDELPVRQWTQGDADFVGAEAEVKARLAETDAGRFDLRVFADSVRGELDAGGDLPRIAPGRFGTGLSWERGGWRANLAGIRYAEQDRVAEFETPTAGYTLVNAHLSYGFDAGPAEWEVYVDGTNLGDREARVHTSFLKDVAPLPGRGIAFGIRSWF